MPGFQRKNKLGCCDKLFHCSDNSLDFQHCLSTRPRNTSSFVAGQLGKMSHSRTLWQSRGHDFRLSCRHTWPPARVHHKKLLGYLRCGRILSFMCCVHIVLRTAKRHRASPSDTHVSPTSVYRPPPGCHTLCQVMAENEWPGDLWLSFGLLTVQEKEHQRCVQKVRKRRGGASERVRNYCAHPPCFHCRHRQVHSWSTVKELVGDRHHSFHIRAQHFTRWWICVVSFQLCTGFSGRL